MSQPPHNHHVPSGFCCVYHVERTIQIGLSFALIRKVIEVFLRMSLFCLWKILPQKSLEQVIDQLAPRSTDPIAYQEMLDRICQPYGDCSFSLATLVEPIK